MSIRNVRQSKAVIVLSVLFALIIVATAVMRAGVSEAQQGVVIESTPGQPSRVIVDRQYSQSERPSIGFGPLPTPGRWSNPSGVRGFRFDVPTTTTAPMTEGDRRAAELANRIRQTADKEARESLRGELRETLNKAFDERREQQLQEIEQLQKQLAAIRDLDEKRQQRKEEIVQRRMSELLSEPDALDWEPKRPQGQYGFPTAFNALPSGPGFQNPTMPYGPNSGPGLPPPGQNVLVPSGVVSNFSITSNVERKGEGTTLPKVAVVNGFGGGSTAAPVDNDEFIYTLSESVGENVEELKRIRYITNASKLSSTERDQFAAIEARLLAKIENGRSVWRMIGKQRERDAESAARNLELAKRSLEMKTAAFNQGRIAESDLLEENKSLESANDDFARMQDRLSLWKELDKKLVAASAELGLSDSEPEVIEESKEEVPVEAVEEQGARRSKVQYEVRFSYRITIWQSISSRV